MKKSLLALAALTAFAGAASAQSSVTLFGIVDVNVNSTKNGSAGTLKSLSTDGANSSRLGFRGVEDLGGGLRAGFWLEAGLSPDTGAAGGGNGNYNASDPTRSGTGAAAGSGTATAQSGTPGALFQRRSTVSLLGGFGEVRLGRDYSPTFWNITIFDPFGTNGVADSNKMRSALGSSTQTQVRVSNSVAYHLPNLYGIYGQGTIAAGENVVGNKYLGFRLGYAAGPVNVALAVSNAKKTLGGANPGTPQPIADFKTWNVGGSFNFGFLTLSGFFEKNKYDVLNQKIALIGLTVPFGASTLKASFIRDTGSSDNYKANQIALGYLYDLSKRTALYAHLANIKNKGNSTAGGNFVVSGGNTTGFVRGETSTGYQFGVRHSF